jgi:hypothetical protein
VTERATHLKLTVDVGSDPITGLVAIGAGAPVSFCGWIELVGAIEAVRHAGDVVSDQVLISPSGEVPVAKSTEPALAGSTEPVVADSTESAVAGSAEPAVG